jgi:hypothetical protein
MKRIGDPAKLTVLFWKGPDPMPGDAVKTSTGRRYLIQRLKFGKPRNRNLGPLRALECVVIGPADVVPGRTFEWTCGKRQRRAA